MADRNGAAEGILEGRTYPHLPFVDDVQVVLDIGANAGAATRYLAHHRPDAKIYAFEPAAGPRQFLERMEKPDCVSTIRVSSP